MVQKYSKQHAKRNERATAKAKLARRLIPSHVMIHIWNYMTVTELMEVICKLSTQDRQNLVNFNRNLTSQRDLKIQFSPEYPITSKVNFEYAFKLSTGISLDLTNFDDNNLEQFKEFLPIMQQKLTQQNHKIHFKEKYGSNTHHENIKSAFSMLTQECQENLEIIFDDYMIFDVDDEDVVEKFQIAFQSLIKYFSSCKNLTIKSNIETELGAPFFNYLFRDISAQNLKNLENIKLQGNSWCQDSNIELISQVLQKNCKIQILKSDLFEQDEKQEIYFSPPEGQNMNLGQIFEFAKKYNLDGMKIICDSIQREFLSSTPLKREIRLKNSDSSDSESDNGEDSLENKFDMADPINYEDEEKHISHNGQNYSFIKFESKSSDYDIPYNTLDVENVDKEEGKPYSFQIQYEYVV